MRQRVGDIHISAVDPELAVRSLVDLVVKNDEVTNLLKFNLRLTIELVNFGLSDTVMREMLHKASQARLNQMNTGGFKRLEEAACQAKRDNIFIPLFFSSTRFEGDVSGLCQRLAFHMV